jgi:hypothetical protein
MTAALRPMNLGEILDRSFSLYRQRFWLFAGLAALPALAILSLHAADLVWLHSDQWVHSRDQGQAAVIGFLRWLVYVHISSFAGCLFFPAYVRATSATVFEERVSIRASLRFALARWRGYLWIAILKITAVLVIPELLAFGAMIVAVIVLLMLKTYDTQNMIQLSIVFLVPFAGGIFLICWVGVRTAFMIPAAALEELAGFKALRRGWKLSRGSGWRIFVAWLMVFLGALALQLAVYLLLRWFSSFLYLNHLHWINQQAMYQITYTFYAAIATLLGPIYPIAVTLLYYDQRVRKEVYDLEKMMEDAGWNASAVANAGKEVEVAEAAVVAE